ncbi:MAG: molybdopterin-guanine dinucleotide biosynthesis protein A [Glaciecola sp.]|jgi:molybdopterin-guanine dinucleotide biosynthesis protein A
MLIKCRTISLRIGLVLNGGKSTRMGKDKSTMRVGNSSMLGKSIAIMDPLNLDNVFISGREFDIPDIITNKGPVGGIYSAIFSRALKAGDTLVVLPNDMPLMQTQVLSHLLVQSLERRCTCVYENQPMPLCLFVSEKILERLRELESSQGMSIRYLIAADKVHEIKADSVDVFANVNTMEEWSNLVELTNEN